MDAVTTVCSLKRYARFHQQNQPEEANTGIPKGSWQYFGDEPPLKMVLHGNGHLLLTSGSTIMESLNLNAAGSWVRGTSKGDSMLIVCKIKDRTRRFRVQFSECSGQRDVEVCKNFTEKLSMYFPIKVLPTDSTRTPSAIGNPNQGEKEEILEGEITLSKVAQVITKEIDNSFPAAYQKCCNIPENQLEFIIRLCLSDPTFPAFVEEIEKKLVNIKNPE